MSVDGEGCPSSADETEERQDVLDDEGEGAAGNGYSKSVVGPMASPIQDDQHFLDREDKDGGEFRRNMAAGNSRQRPLTRFLLQHRTTQTRRGETIVTRERRARRGW